MFMLQKHRAMWSTWNAERHLQIWTIAVDYYFNKTPPSRTPSTFTDFEYCGSLFSYLFTTWLWLLSDGHNYRCMSAIPGHMLLSTLLSPHVLHLQAIIWSDSTSIGPPDIRFTSPEDGQITGLHYHHLPWGSLVNRSSTFNIWPQGSRDGQRVKV